MQFKFRTFIRLFFLSLLLVVSACNIPRDNPLDPKNPDSKQAQKVLIQAFVNTENNTDYNEYMIQALHQLKNEYDGQLIIAEHHRNTPGAETPYHFVENELLYQTYLSGFENPIKGVPDVFINGIDARVQGASSVATALLRLQEAVSNEVKQDCHFLVDIDYESSGSGIKPVVTLARLGGSGISSILIKCMLVSYINADFQAVVTDQAQSRLIDHMDHGESEVVELPQLNVNTSYANSLVVYVTDQSEQRVYQSESIQL